MIKSLRMSNIDVDKQYIITLFNNNIKGNDICVKEQNYNHDGKEGYWLEKQMGIKHNGKNEPDINGYEMKKYSNIITLCDLSACEYIFSKKRCIINKKNNWTDNEKIDRTTYIKIFGNPNPIKNNRYSWSGSCVPKYDSWNYNGQILSITENNDIIVYYSFSKDARIIKNNFPIFLQCDDIVIALWNASKIQLCINNKFNNKGFFMCKKINNKYEKICFGKAFNFEYFIECIKNKKVIFDSGMYVGNYRNYSHFRGLCCFWNDLITEEY